MTKLQIAISLATGVIAYFWQKRRQRKAHDDKVARGMEERKANDPKERIKRAIYNPREHRTEKER